jgi:SAM-dependent methyltransferase
MEKADLDALYRQADVEYWPSTPDTRVDWRIARKWLSERMTSESSILDVGCWTGAFLQSVGTDGRRFGVEINQQAQERATEAGVRIIGREFTAMPPGCGPFDAVTTFDVIEHTHNPLAFLSELTRVVSDNGVIIVSSGNNEAFTWRLLGARYWYCTLAEHLTFISPRWCEWVAPRVGLTVHKMLKFPHAEGTWRASFTQMLSNLFYAASPSGFSWLRARGFGGAPYRSHPDLLQHPPPWMSANDHFICLFVKKCTTV